MQYKRCTGGGYTRSAGGATESCNCSCGCSAQSDCSAVGGAVLGAAYNAGQYLLRNGGNGSATTPFPRFPWYKVGYGIIPSICDNSRCAMLWVYQDAVHDGTTYSGLDPSCMTVLATAWKPNGSRRFGSHWRSRGPCDAYNSNVQRKGYAYDSAWHNYLYYGGVTPPGSTGPAAKGYQTTYWPRQIGSSGTLLYGGPVKYISDATPYWFTPTSAEMTLFASFTSGLVAAGVKHTLILYVRAWHTAYSALDWDGTSWPWWWDADGLTAAGAANMEAYLAGGRTGTLSPAGSRFFRFTHSRTGGWPTLSGYLAQGGRRQINREPFFAGIYGAATSPMTDANSRVHLIGAHVLCAPCDNVIAATSGGTFVPNLAPDGGDGTTTCGNITCSADIDLSVLAYASRCELVPPAAGSGSSSWLTIGTPYRTSITSPGCWTSAYHVPLHFTGTGSTTLTFGGRVYNLTKT